MATASSSRRQLEADLLAQFVPPPGFHNQQNSVASQDEYEDYLSMAAFPCDQPLQWWGEQRQKYPLLSQLALDLLSIPLMSAECERVFSDAKTVNSDQRACLKEDIIKASVILRQWLNAEPEVDPE